MPADRETMEAIHALAENLRNAVDGRLNAAKEESDRGRQRIYDRIDEHAKEARAQNEVLGSEMRTNMREVAVAIATLSTELRAHSQYDEAQFARHDRELDTVRSKAHELAGKVDALKDAGAGDSKKLWNVLAWLFGALGFGTGAWSKWGGGQ